MLRMRPARAAGRALRAETLRRLPRRTGACWRGRAPRPGAELESLEGACETRGGSLGPSAPLGRPKDKASPLHQSPALPSVPVRLEDTSVPGFSWPSSPGTRTRRQPGRRAKRCDAGRWGLLGSRPSTQQPPEGRPRRTHEVKPPRPPPRPGAQPPTLGLAARALRRSPAAHSQPVSRRMLSTSGIRAAWELREPMAEQEPNRRSPPASRARPPQRPRGRRPQA